MVRIVTIHINSGELIIKMDNLLGSSNSSQPSRKRSVILVLALFGVVCVAGSLLVLSRSPSSSTILAQFELEEQEFQQYIIQYNKAYTNEEYVQRLQTFRDNLAFIRIQNSLGNDWVLGVNKFADLSPAEFKARYLSKKMDLSSKKPAQEFVQLTDLPTKIDWRTEGAVTGVKNQGQCGSCWAFSTTGSVEGIWKISGNPLVSLSEQELVDCSTSYGNQGCNGGLMDDAFEFIKDNGITLESAYPYLAVDGTCNTALEKQIAANITGYVNVAANNPTALQTAATSQPISVAVQADQYVWQYYKSGTITKNCGHELDHGVLIVGYDTTSSPNFWIVKNSWGPDWGLGGYVQIAITAKEGVCGINMSASYPTL